MMKDVQIQIGMRWNHPSVEVICRETERFLGWLTHFETTHMDPGKRIPVHWNFPSHPFLELRARNLDDLILEIKARIQSKNDIPVSMGYSGGVHPLLSLPELKKDCEWGITNPWESGIRDTFGKASGLIMPYTPDLLRPGAVTCYAKNECTTIGINIYSIGQFHFENIKNLYPGLLKLFYFLPLSEYLVKQLKRDMKKLLEECNYVLPFFFDCMFIEEVVKIPFDFNPFTAALELLMSKYTVRFTSYDTTDTIKDFLPDTDSRVSQDFYLYSRDDRDILPNHPIWRRNADSVKKERALTEKTDSIMKDILKTISPLYLVLPGKEDSLLKEKFLPAMISFPPEDRINAADMQGQVTLSGDSFSVMFAGGKIKNLLFNKKKILAGELACSYIRFSDTRYDLTTMSAFSIAGDTCRGLREIQKIIIDEDEPYGTQLTDYIFAGDFPYLIISTKVTYPYLPSNEDIRGHALFEIPLFYFDVNKHIDLHLYSDSLRTSYKLEPVQKVFSLTGNAFVFSKGETSVIAGFPVGKGPDHQVLSVRIKKSKEGFCLCINPGGSYFSVPGSYFSRLTEVFSFYFGICPASGEEVLPFPDYVLDEIPGNVVYKE